MVSLIFIGCKFRLSLGKGAKKKGKKLTIVSFMYVCVAGNGEMLDFLSFFSATIVKKTILFQSRGFEH